MKKTLTPGRWRGLRLMSTDQNIFAVLAFDQRGTYRRMLPPDTPHETAVAIKTEIVVALSEHVSAVLLDAEYGLTPALTMSGHTGLLMALEKSGYSGDSTYRRVAFGDGWTVGKIRQMGASAVKLLAYYHPRAGTLTDEIEALIRQIADECHQADMPLFVEPMSYSLDAETAKESAEFARNRPDLVIETAKRLSRLNPDVLKMEFPVDVAFESDRARWQSTCEALSEASVVPWVLLSAGVDFETFAEQAAVACRAGASGYLAGRAIWKEAVAMDAEARRQFLKTTAPARLNQLNAIVSRVARPWTDFYTPLADTNEWWMSAPDAAQP